MVDTVAVPIAKCGHPRRQEPDRAVLRQGCEEAEEEVEQVLQKDRKMGDRRVVGQLWRQGLDPGPGEVDAEQQEKRAEAEDRRLKVGE